MGIIIHVHIYIIHEYIINTIQQKKIDLMNIILGTRQFIDNIMSIYMVNCELLLCEKIINYHYLKYINKI